MQKLTCLSGGNGIGWLLPAAIAAVALASSCSRPSEPRPAAKRPATETAPGPKDQSAPSPIEKSSTTPAPAPQLATNGRELFTRHCAACHGERGDGQGQVAAYLFPKPRDFRAGRFRLVSTKNGVPTGDDLRAVLRRGMPGSSMPPWAHLAPAELDALVEEVMRLRREGAHELYMTVLKEQDGLTDEEIAADEIQEEVRNYVERSAMPGETTELPEIAASTAERLAHGREVYVRQACGQCHGADGKGDGVQKMVDDEQLPTSPRDFTKGIFKGGHDPGSLYRRIAYGMPGTPMPSSTLMTPEEMVDLVHYVRSLSTEELREDAVLKRNAIAAAYVDEIPQTADAEGWSAATATRVRLMPLWWRDVDGIVRAQAVHDGDRLAVRLAWNDATHDRHSAETESFEDAIALQVYRGQPEPFLGMGSPAAPVDVWYWDADRQDPPLDVEDVYPRMVVDIYPFNEPVASDHEFSRPSARTAHQPDISFPARASGNQIMPAAGQSAGTALVAGGAGSVTFRLPQSQHVEARGQWHDGQWVVVMIRKLRVPDEGDGVTLVPGQRASLAIAVWDGAHRDRNGQKSISIWQDLILETADTSSAASSPSMTRQGREQTSQGVER